MMNEYVYPSPNFVPPPPPPAGSDTKGQPTCSKCGSADVHRVKKTGLERAVDLIRSHRVVECYNCNTRTKFYYEALPKKGFYVLAVTIMAGLVLPSLIQSTSFQVIWKELGQKAAQTPNDNVSQVSAALAVQIPPSSVNSKRVVAEQEITSQNIEAKQSVSGASITKLSRTGERLPNLKATSETKTTRQNNAVIADKVKTSARSSTKDNPVKGTISQALDRARLAKARKKAELLAQELTKKAELIRVLKNELKSKLKTESTNEVRVVEAAKVIVSTPKALKATLIPKAALKEVQASIQVASQTKGRSVISAGKSSLNQQQKLKLWKSKTASLPATATSRLQLELNPNSFTMQLASLESEDQLRGLVKRLQTESKFDLSFYFFLSEKQSTPWYPLMYGVFSDRTKANNALAGLPKRWQDRGPIIRQIKDNSMPMKLVR